MCFLSICVPPTDRPHPARPQPAPQSTVPIVHSQIKRTVPIVSLPFLLGCPRCQVNVHILECSDLYDDVWILIYFNIKTNYDSITKNTCKCPTQKRLYSTADQTQMPRRWLVCVRAAACRHEPEECSEP